MIPFDLVNDLRKANFPHDWSKFDALHPTLIENDWKENWQEFTPSLEKVIEACRSKEKFKRFRVLELQSEENYAWYAGAGDWSDAFGYNYSGKGNTPLEAVIKLWLAINKKE